MLVIDAPDKEEAMIIAADILEDIDETNARSVFDDHSFDSEIKEIEEAEGDEVETDVL